MKNIPGGYPHLPQISINLRVNIRVNFRINFENGGKENPEKEKFWENIRPNGVDFLNPEVQKPLTSIFEPNRSNFFFEKNGKIDIYIFPNSL